MPVTGAVTRPAVSRNGPAATDGIAVRRVGRADGLAGEPPTSEPRGTAREPSRCPAVTTRTPPAAAARGSALRASRSPGSAGPERSRPRDRTRTGGGRGRRVAAAADESAPSNSTPTSRRPRRWIRRHRPSSGWNCWTPTSPGRRAAGGGPSPRSRCAQAGVVPRSGPCRHGYCHQQFAASHGPHS